MIFNVSKHSIVFSMNYRLTLVYFSFIFMVNYFAFSYLIHAILDVYGGGGNLANNTLDLVFLDIKTLLSFFKFPHFSQYRLLSLIQIMLSLLKKCSSHSFIVKGICFILQNKIYLFEKCSDVVMINNLFFKMSSLKIGMFFHAFLIQYLVPQKLSVD